MGVEAAIMVADIRPAGTLPVATRAGISVGSTSDSENTMRTKQG